MNTRHQALVTEKAEGSNYEKIRKITKGWDR